VSLRVLVAGAVLGQPLGGVRRHNQALLPRAHALLAAEGGGVGVLVGRDRAEVERRTADLLELVGAEVSAEDWFVPRRARWIYGTPDEARQTVDRYAAAGVARLMLQDLLPWDLDMVDLLGQELVARG